VFTFLCFSAVSKDPITLPDQFLAAVFAEHGDVRIPKGNAEQFRHPAVGVFPVHDPGFPDLIKSPVRFDSETSEIPVRQGTHRDVRPWICTDIALARRVSAAHIKLVDPSGIAIDFRCRSQDRCRAAARASDLALSGFALLFLLFQDRCLLFWICLNTPTGFKKISLYIKKLCKNSDFSVLHNSGNSHLFGLTTFLA
jgi:hypothetical protein